MDNKKFIYIGGAVIGLIVIILIILTIASGSKNKNNNNKNNGPQVITFWNLSEDKALFENAITDFQSKNSNIKIEYVKKDPKNFSNELLNQIAAGKGPDIVSLPHDWIPKFQDKLIPLPENKLANKKAKKSGLEVYQDTFPQAVIQDNVIDSKIFGAPLALDPLVLFYNNDLLTNALDSYRVNHPEEDISNLRRLFDNGPRTWDDFTLMSRIISQKSGENISTAGVALGGSANVTEAPDILAWIMLQYGTKMVSDDHTTAQFHTQFNSFDTGDFPGRAALDFYASFAKPSNENYTWNSSQPDSMHAFADGKAAMMFDYFSKTGEIKNINQNLNFNYFSLPQIKETKNPVSYLTYKTYSVTRASQNSGVAWDFILSLIDINFDNEYVLNVHERSPLMSSLANSDEPLAIQIKNAQSWYKPDPDKADAIFREMIKQVNEGQSSQTALDGAAAQITTLLEQLKQ